MNYQLVLVAVLVAVVAADHHEECGVLQRLSVKSQWQRAYSAGHDREHFAVAVMRAVVAQVPQLKTKLAEHGADDVGSAKFAANALRIMSGVDVLINLIDQPDAFRAQVEYVQHRRGDRVVPETVKQAFRRALAHVLPAQLGRCFDKEPWKTCYYEISHGFSGDD